MERSVFNAGRYLTRRGALKTGGLLLAGAGIRGRRSLLHAASDDQTVQPGCLALPPGYPRSVAALASKLDPANDTFIGERYVAEIVPVLDRWSAGLRRDVRDTRMLAEQIPSSVLASGFHPSETTTLRSTGSLTLERRSFGEPKTIARTAWLQHWASYFAGFESLEVADFEIYRVDTKTEPRLDAETQIRYDFVGTRQDGSREQRGGSWHIAWEKNAQGQWMVVYWSVEPELRSHSSCPGFIDVTGHAIDPAGSGARQLAAGVDHWRTVLDGASGIDVYGNQGIAVGDIDGSGYDSFYVCQPSGLPNRLYRNRGDGTFEDITDHSGTGVLDGTASAIFADFLNRGAQDLLVVRTTGPLLFANLGSGKFEPKPDAFRFARQPQGTFTSAAVADYDRDGLLDIFFCVYSYYQGLNQYQFPFPYYDAQNGPPNFLFRNRGDGTFEDVTATSGIDQNNNRFSFAAAWADDDGDGWPDLYVANDFGRKNFYRNSRGKFTDVAEQSGIQDYGPGMSVCWLDHDNDGRDDLYVANMWLAEGKRITADPAFLPGAPAGVRGLYQKHNAGNSLYRNLGNGKFEDRSIQAGTAIGRWSWSCASWDFDHDGYPDIYVANGFVSGPKRFDLQSFFWRQVAQRSIPGSAAPGEYETAWNAINELARSDYSWSGYQRNAFYANSGDGTFTDISGLLGLDFRDDSRAFALSDIDHDGRLEIVLKNRTGPQLRILRNEFAAASASVAFRLRGVRSNRDAIGAKVTVVAGSLRQTKFVSAGSGFASQNTKELNFGVGNASSVSVTVAWPDGSVQRHERLPVNNRFDIVQGEREISREPYREPAVRNALPLRSTGTPEPAGIWLAAPLLAPDPPFSDRAGRTRRVSEFRGRPVVLVFVAPGCEQSSRQVAIIRESLLKTSAAGIEICIGQFGAAEGNDHPGVSIFRAGEKTMAAWNVQYRYLFDRRRDMSFPSSFLLDSNGAVIRVYRGLVEPAEFIRDWKSAPGTVGERLSVALPFRGPLHGTAFERNYFTYGVAFVEHGLLQDAQRAFQHAIDANPSYASAWFNLGTVYLNQKNYAEARRCLRECVRLSPDDADAWNNLGMISGEEQKYDEALEEFRRAAFARPGHILPVQNMMRIFEYQGRPGDAGAVLEQLLARSPESADLHIALARVLLGQRRADAALEQFETAARLGPNRPDILNDLGAMLMQAGRLREALARFEECQRLAPDFDRPWLNMALVYEAAGQPDKARDVLTDFLRRHPDNVPVREALGRMSAR